MREKDLEIVALLLDDPSLQGAKRIAILSPASNINEIEHVKTKFPDADLEIFTIDSWDLNKGPCPGGRVFDLTIACGIFMCAKNPAPWFENVMSCSRFFLIQDLVRGQRGHDGSETDPDTGDLMRFSWTSRGEKARIDGAYDMTLHNAETVAVEFYSDRPSHSGHDCRKFAAILKQKPAGDEKSPRRGKKS